jgi:hypothetical protein
MKPGFVMYTLGMRSGLLKITVFGPVRIISPYFSCDSWWMRWQRFVKTHQTRCKLVKLPRNGPGMCLSLHHVRTSCKTPRTDAVPRKRSTIL